jgi:twinfilin-like protein
MLFASTRLTLVRELGIERFRETIFATTKEELTKEGFEKHDRHVRLDAPLTEEEMSLGEVKRKEAEEGRGAAERRSHVSSGVSMPVSEEAVSALKGLGEDAGDDLVQLVCFPQFQDTNKTRASREGEMLTGEQKINIATETVELASTSTTPITTLSSTISSTEPRYSFYRYAHEYNGASSSPILFIYTCPSGSKIKERMLYAASSRSAQQLAESAGLTIAKKIEASSPEDITKESVDEDLHPKVEVKQAFSRPKRPGRK